jgi:hypothetical protein
LLAGVDPRFAAAHKCIGRVSRGKVKATGIGCIKPTTA